jgi:hypothetical protein
MTDFDLLDTVQPAEGWFAVLGINPNNKYDVKQELVATRPEFDEWVQEYLRQKRNVYFGVAKYRSDENREKDNVLALKAFWVDIDCGEDKAKPNAKTGIPDGYIDQATGLQELQRFCKLVGLPKPLLVNSGRGIHGYWPLTESVTREEWEPVAKRLRDLCQLHNLIVDRKVFEVARVLRPLETFNFKDDPPTPVELICTTDPISYAEFREILGVQEVKEAPPKRELTELAKSMMGNSVSSFKKIMIRSANGTGCQQLLSAYEERESLSEPRWFDALSVAKFCEDRDTAIHKMSQDHPDYDYHSTEQKIRHIVGPHTCAEFENSNPGGCEGCPHKGKIRSPIQLGKEILEATEEDNEVIVPSEEEDEEDEVVTIPKYPQPFFRGKNGGIYKMPASQEEEPVFVYEHDLYVVKRMRDPVLGEVVVMRLHLPRDGVKEFVIPNRSVTDKTELRKELSSHGVVCGTKAFNNLMDFILQFIRDLQFKRKAELMRLQFGWADANSKFIIGDREITKDGTFHSPPSSTTANIAQHMQPTGTLEKWKEVFALYGRPGLEPHAFATLSAFGSPLLKFLGQNGAIINVIHPNSGTGKTTILRMTNSVVGHPERLSAMWDDTLNAKFLRMGVMNNLCFTADEMTNTSPADFSTLSYGMSQGRGKDRVKSSSNELRLNLSSWQCISLCSSNSSFYEKLASLKNTPDGEMMRLLEYKIEYSDAVDVSLAKQMFDHQLMENYGHAGDIYAKWLVDNLEEAKNTALGIQAKLDQELKLTQRERFWSAVAAANITGGLIAKSCGLIDWDMRAIYKWATKMILGLREEVKPPVNDVMAVIGDYINRHMQNIVVVEENVDRRTNMQKLPSLEPKGELLIRYEPDTKKMFLAAKPFKNDCVKFQVNYRDTLQQLEKKGIFTGTVNKRLSKGMKVVAPGVHSLVFDCSNSDFISLDGLVMQEAENAGGEG